MMLPPRGVYAILDAGTAPCDDLVTLAEAALVGGARMLQYRDKAHDQNTAYANARALLTICRHAGVPLIINDDVALTATIGADGVHLGQTDTNIAHARRHLGAGAIIGATCHASPSAATTAARAGASYVSFGRFFASGTKPDAPPADLAVLEQARKNLSLPLVAIGGVDADNGASLLSAGADWLAISAAIFGATDVRAATAEIAALFARLGHHTNH